MLLTPRADAGLLSLQRANTLTHLHPDVVVSVDANAGCLVVCLRFELSMKMREACLILKNHLNDDAKAMKSKEVVRPRFI